jgi:acyl-CoA thioester hydrolase
MELTARVAVKAQFCECDPMGVVWHGNYLRYFEQARVALMESINYSYRKMAESGYSWPIIDTRIKFIKPVVCDQTVVVRATLGEYEYRLRIDYEIRDSVSGARLTRGYTTQVAVDMKTGEMCFATPKALLEQLKAR